MSVAGTLPRLVGAFSLINTVRLLPWALGAPLPQSLPWIVAVALWLAASLALLRGDQIRLASGMIALLAFVAMPGVQPQDAPDLALLTWVSVILAVTDGRPAERALLLRVCVTCVYAFTAAAKTNPSFLAGEQITMIVETRPQLQEILGGIPDWTSVSIAVATVAIEAWLAVGLWVRRARRATAIIGVAFHAVLVPAAVHDVVIGVPMLLVLNGLLVVSYIAFFDPDPFDARGVLARTS